MSLSIKTLPSCNFSSSRVLSSPHHVSLTSNLHHLSLHTTKSPPIRMGGGPRTFPGGVSKWEWKRMQEKKAKHLLKSRLVRERQIYEIRKRAELKSAVSELERPWEVVKKPPWFLSVSADEQVKVLADRFQRPGGFDLWSEKDGPQLFMAIDGVSETRLNNLENLEPKNGVERSGFNKLGRLRDRSRSGGQVEEKNLAKSAVDGNGKGSSGEFRKMGKMRRFGVDHGNNLNGLASGGVGVIEEQKKETTAERNGDNRLRTCLE
ncbi:unnamed protein product [Camellia sinensis]